MPPLADKPWIASRRSAKTLPRWRSLRLRGQKHFDLVVGAGELQWREGHRTPRLLRSVVQSPARGPPESLSDGDGLAARVWNIRSWTMCSTRIGTKLRIRAATNCSVACSHQRMISTARLVVVAPLVSGQLICARRFEPWSCEMRDRIGGRPERFVICRADVTEVAVAPFGVVRVVDVVGNGCGQLQSGRPFTGVGNSTCSRAQNDSSAALS